MARTTETRDTREPRHPRDDVRASAWLDGALPPSEREAFERELAREPKLTEEVRRLERTVALLRATSCAQAPPDFLAGVQARIRRRTRGRSYGATGATRLPLEAIFNVVLVALLIALYVAAIPRPDGEVRPRGDVAAVQSLGQPHAAAALLGTYGEVEVVAGSQSPAGLTYRVSVPRPRLPALRDELALYPYLRVIEPPLPEATPEDFEVRVRVERR